MRFERDRHLLGTAFALLVAASVGLAGVRAARAPTASEPAVLLAAGDIASCNSRGDEATALILDRQPGTVAPLGDNVYEIADLQTHLNCYDPSWGRHRSRTRPAPGNHEYVAAQPDAVGYYQYFGAAAGELGRGYYSYDLGSWHIVVLNSNASYVPTAAGSAQEQWLREDLRVNARPCTLAYWHYPLFSSQTDDRRRARLKPLWDALYAAGAEVVLSSHHHIYARFAPQTPEGWPDPERGIRQFVVGTGGKSHDDPDVLTANIEVQDHTSFGILKLTLEEGGYAWEFLPAAGGTFTDSGRGTCH
jgi:acid phosphatase type 7